MAAGTTFAAEPDTPPSAPIIASATPTHPRYRQVTVTPTKTSIYIGSVTLTMPPFTRTNGEYATTYTAKVFPYFFANEQGQLWIEFSDEQLGQLERGERVFLKGRARNAQGNERRVEGQATPDDIASGKVKVRVFVSRTIELIFNTTYRFTGETAPAPETPAATAKPTAQVQ